MINNYFKKITRRVQGFTLIETMIAVLLLSTAIAGPLTLAAKAYSTALIAKDQIGAFYLAQDAVEYVRFARDTNCLAAGSQSGGCPAANWLAGNSNPNQTVNLSACEGSSGCYLDSLGNSPTAPTACSGTCPVMNYDKTNHYYTYNAVGGSIITPSEQYVRTVQITTPVGSNTSEAQVTVSVSWVGQNGITHKVTVLENLLNWE